jgi:hypothetical protein
MMHVSSDSFGSGPDLTVASWLYARLRTGLAVGGIVLMVAWTTGCIDPLTPDVDAPRPAPLVVDGSVTDGPGPHEVRVTRAAAFEQSGEGAIRGVPGAAVTIIDETTGRRVGLTEASPTGTYRTAAGELTGTPGHAYRLQVTLSDGTVIRSETETMPPPVPIDSARAVYVAEPSPGFEVRVSSPEPAGAPSYYRWSVRSTFEAPVLPEPMVPPFFCWAEDGIGQEVAVRSDRLIDGERIVDERVRFVEAGSKTSLAYQVDVTQRTLTQSAFAFWTQIEEQVEDVGDPFAPPPSPVRGNLRNETNPEARVLGYFSAAGATQATVCIDARTDPGAPLVPFRDADDPCAREEVSFQVPSYWTCSSRQN